MSHTTPDSNWDQYLKVEYKNKNNGHFDIIYFELMPNVENLVSVKRCKIEEKEVIHENFDRSYNDDY